MEEQLKGFAPVVDDAMRDFFPKKVTREWLERFLDAPEFKADLEALDKAVAEPVWDLLDRGGKRWRPYLCARSLEAVGGSWEPFKAFLVLPEMIHNGTLMVDDVEDNSQMRRGQPCSHIKFGKDIAVNAGNTLYFLPMSLLYAHKDKLSDATARRIYEIFNQEMLKLSLGQAMDICWHRGLKEKVSEEEYLQMCSYKTGTLARFAAKLGAILGGGSDEQVEALGRFSAMVGVAFQIQDDVLNLAPGEDWGKEVGDDINEGKRTLLVIRALDALHPDDGARLLGILDKHTEDEAEIKEAIALLEKADAFAYAKKRASSLVHDAWARLDPLLDETPAKRQLKEIADFLISRKI